MKYQNKLSKDLKKLSSNEYFLHQFLLSLMSVAEFKDIAMRWQIIQLLQKKITHRDIAKNLGVGIATVTRCSLELKKPNNGYLKALQYLSLVKK